MTRLMTRLSDALFSSAQQPILALLYGEPKRWLHLNELIRLTGLGSATVQRELARLEKGGLIETRRIGNLKQLRAFEGNPIFDELRLIVLKTFGAAEIRREALAPLASGINFAFVYGSVAQGSDHCYQRHRSDDRQRHFELRTSHSGTSVCRAATEAPDTGDAVHSEGICRPKAAEASLHCGGASSAQAHGDRNGK